MKYKTTILITATTNGQNCHRQCRGLVDISDTSGKQYCCSIFGHALLESVHGDILRSAMCLVAQRKARKIYMPLIETLIEMKLAFCAGDEWIGVPIRDAADKAINNKG